MSGDPFAHHPGLREKITPFSESYFRDFDLKKVQRDFAGPNIEDLPLHDDATRESLRAAALQGRLGRDLWVFAYGSLMWNPALDFAEVRRAFAPGHERRFILRDIYGGRGTAEKPGLMAALDQGAGCAGLAFRLAADMVEAETEILFKREMIGPGYHAVFIPVDIECGRIEALSFVADHDSDMIAPDLSRVQTVDYIATGAGILGTSLDYLKNVIDHLHDMGIPDAELDALLADVDAHIAANRE